MLASHLSPANGATSPGPGAAGPVSPAGGPERRRFPRERAVESGVLAVTVELAPMVVDAFHEKTPTAMQLRNAIAGWCRAPDIESIFRRSVTRSLLSSGLAASDAEIDEIGLGFVAPASSILAVSSVQLVQIGRAVQRGDVKPGDFGPNVTPIVLGQKLSMASAENPVPLAGPLAYLATLFIERMISQRMLQRQTLRGWADWLRRAKEDPRDPTAAREAAAALAASQAAERKLAKDAAVMDAPSVRLCADPAAALEERFNQLAAEG